MRTRTVVITHLVIYMILGIALLAGCGTANQIKQEATQQQTKVAEQPQKQDAWGGVVSQPIPEPEWGEVVGSPVVIRPPDRGSNLYVYQIRHKETGKIVILTIGTSKEKPNSMTQMQ